MKYVLTEYGLLVVAILGCVGMFYMYTYVRDEYKSYSQRFIGSITGSYTEYGSDLTLEQIERGEGF